MAPRRCVPFFSWGWGLPPGCLCIIDILHEGPTQSWALQCPVRRVRSSWERRWLGREYSARRPRKLACQRALRLNGRKQFSWGMRSSACVRGLQNVGLAQETEERGVLLVPAGRGSASSPSRGCKPTCGETRSFHRYIHTHGQKFKSSPSPPSSSLPLLHLWRRLVPHQSSQRPGLHGAFAPEGKGRSPWKNYLFFLEDSLKKRQKIQLPLEEKVKRSFPFD